MKFVWDNFQVGFFPIKYGPRMLSNPSTIDGLSNALLSVLRSALEASVVSDGNDASVQNQVCIPLQVDPSRCSLGCLDIKTKVVFQYMLLIRVILKRSFCFDINTTLGTT